MRFINNLNADDYALISNQFQEFLELIKKGDSKALKSFLEKKLMKMKLPKRGYENFLYNGLINSIYENKPSCFEVIYKNESLNDILIEARPGDCLYEAFIHGNLEIVEFILEGSKLKNRIKLKNDYEFLFKAAMLGHVDVLNYFFKHSNLPKVLINICFMGACEGGKLNVLEWMYSNEDLLKGLSMSNKEHDGLLKACEFSHLNVVKFLLENDFQKVDMYRRNGLVLDVALDGKSEELIEYFLIEKEMQIDDRLRDKINGNVFADKLLQKRDLKARLIHNSVENVEKIKSKKI